MAAPETTSGLTNVTLTLPLTNATPTLSPEDQALFDQYYAIRTAIKHSYMWVIFGFGFPGNLASLVVILRLRSFGSPALYVATLAVVDNIAIVCKVVMLQIAKHKLAPGEVGCKLMFFLGNHLVLYANWVLVVMAIERLLAVRRPLHVHHLWSSRKAAISLAVILLLTFAFTIPVLVAARAKNNGRVCQIDPQYRQMMSQWQWSQVAAFGFLPCFLLTTINILIIVTLSRAGRSHRTLTPTFSHTNSISNDTRNVPSAGIQRQATVMLVVTSAILVLTTTPVCVYLPLSTWWRPRPNTVDFARKHLVAFAVRAVCDFNHAVNFYLYFISARKFRTYFCKMFCWLCYRWDGRSGSQFTVRHLSASESTMRIRDKSQGHLLNSKRELVTTEMPGENNIHLMVFTNQRQTGRETPPCSSPL